MSDTGSLKTFDSLAAVMPPGIEIHSLLLPDLRFANREEFLYLRKQFVIELALRHHDFFSRKGGNASHFHKRTEDTGFGVPLIHCLDYNNVFCLRAYGAHAIQTLKLWQEWARAVYPHMMQSVASMSESYLLGHTDEPVFYGSSNYIPFNNCIRVDGCFADADRLSDEVASMLQNRLIGNLRTFLKNIGLDDRGMHTIFKLQQYPAEGRSYAALLKDEIIRKTAFEVVVQTNLQLPLFFSLGQNVGYGCGLFERVMKKSQNQVRNIIIF